MSVAGAIADAIVTAVQGLGIPGTTVTRRKTMSLPQGEDPIQIVVVVKESGRREPMTAHKDFVTRPAAVGIFKGGGKALADDDTFRGWLESIAAAVNQRGTFASVPQFDQVDVGKETPYEGAALAKDINLGVELFEVRTIESRN